MFASSPSRGEVSVAAAIVTSNASRAPGFSIASQFALPAPLASCARVT